MADIVVSVPPGERRHGGVPPVDQGAEPLLLQAADEPSALPILLPGLPAHATCAGPHVPLWRPVTMSLWFKCSAEVCTFLFMKLIH